MKTERHGCGEVTSESSPFSIPHSACGHQFQFTDVSRESECHQQGQGRPLDQRLLGSSVASGMNCMYAWVDRWMLVSMVVTGQVPRRQF